MEAVFLDLFFVLCVFVTIEMDRNIYQFGYSEKDVNDNDPNFVMNGTITAVNQPNSLVSTVNKQNSTSTTRAKTSSTDIDTVGTYMIPAKDLAKDVAKLTNAGLSVDSTFTYKDARGGEQGNWS